MSSQSNGRAFDRRFYGVVEAVVKDNVDPDKLGRIKITFPWYDEGTITEWCRVRQLYAGNGYGSFFIPEIDDEVLISFVHGDMSMPVILGGLYNEKDKPPSQRQKDDKKNEKLIRTKAGHLLMFDDTKDKEKIRLVTKGGHELELHDEDKDHHDFVSLKTHGGHSVELDDEGNKITIKTSGGQTIVMDANTDTITVSGASVSLSGSHVSLGSSPTERAVLGDALMQLFNAHTHTVSMGVAQPTTNQMTASQLSSVVKVK